VGFLKRVKRVIGREPGDDGLAFGLQAPGAWTFGGPFIGESMSRAHLELCAIDERSATVKNIGSNKLRINGELRTEAVVGVNDVLAVGGYVFLITMRPAVIPKLEFWKEPSPAFGEADVHDIVGETAIVWALRDRLAQLARMRTAVLIHGESGTGKEACAKAIHALSRRKGPFVAENMPTCDTDMGLAHLFGHGKEATGQKGLQARLGRIQMATGGTFFMDEIGELSMRMQACLLRLMQFNEVVPVGSSETQVVDVRLVAATNREIHDRDSLKFDLCGRLTDRVLTPSLNERREDIMLIVRHLVLAMCAESPDHPAHRFVRHVERKPSTIAVDPDFVVTLLRHDFLTNVHELKVLVAASMAQHAAAGVLRTPTTAVQWRPIGSADARVDTASVDVAEARKLVAELGITEAARRLGISRHALRRLLMK
jgi:DNA-binding NtrC family response regulator